MRRIIAVLAGALCGAFFVAQASAFDGEIGAGHVLGNPSAAGRAATDATLSAMFDRAFCGTAGSLLARVGGAWGCAASSPTRAGDIIYWNGSTWATLAGNNSGTNVLTENASGVPSWAAPGTGTVTSVVCNNGTTTITATGTCSSREVLSGSRSYFVRTDGSDSNTGLVNNAGGAFLTIQKAINVVYNSLDLNNNNVTINVADGTYTGAIITSVPQVGFGTIFLTGNIVTPANVLISVTSANALDVQNGAALTVSGVKFTTTTSGTCLNSSGGIVTMNGFVVGPCAGDHIGANLQGRIFLNASYTVSGAGTSHWHVGNQGFIQVGGTTITLTGTPAFSAYFAGGSTNGVVFVLGTAFSGGATGQRYTVHSGAIIDTTASSTSETFLPGSTNGVAFDGGYYNTDKDTTPGWTTYTPGITPASGSFTTVSATGTWRKIDGRTLALSIDFVVTTKGGSAPGTVFLGVPAGISLTSKHITAAAVDQSLQTAAGLAAAFQNSASSVGLAPAGGSFTDGHTYTLTGIFEIDPP